MAHPADDGRGLWRQTREVPLLLVIIFNFSYKNLDVYQYCLSLVLLLMFFISVSLVFKSQTAGTQQRSSAAAKGQSQRRHSRATVPREGLPALWAAGRAHTASPCSLPPGSLGLSPGTTPRSGPREAPTALGPDSLPSPLLARPCSSGGPAGPRATPGALAWVSQVRAAHSTMSGS